MRRVLLVGATPSNMVTASILKRQGVYFDMIDPKSNILQGSDSQAVILPPNAQKILDEIGLLGEVKKEGMNIEVKDMLKRNTTVKFTSSKYQDIRNFKGYSPLGIAYGSYMKILSHPLGNKGIKVRQQLKQVKQRGDQYQCSFSSQVAGVKYDMIIGGDAKASKVLYDHIDGNLGIEEGNEREDRTDCGVWSVITDKKMIPTLPNRYIEIWGSGIMSGIYPVSKDQVALYFVHVPKEGASMAHVFKSGPREGSDFPAILGDIFKTHNIPEVIEEVKARSKAHPIHVSYRTCRLRKAWSHQGIGLIGDGLYENPFTPQLEQNLLLEDGYVLGQLLCKDDLSEEDIWRQFKQKREKRLKSAQKECWKLYQDVMKTGGFSTFTRNAKLSISGGVSFSKSVDQNNNVPSHFQ